MLSSSPPGSESYICVSKYFIPDDLVVSGTLLSRDIPQSRYCHHQRVAAATQARDYWAGEVLNKIKFLRSVFNKSNRAREHKMSITKTMWHLGRLNKNLNCFGKKMINPLSRLLLSCCWGEEKEIKSSTLYISVVCTPVRARATSRSRHNIFNVKDGKRWCLHTFDIASL